MAEFGQKLLKKVSSKVCQECAGLRTLCHSGCVSSNLTPCIEKMLSEFIHKLEKLKKIKRKGWVLKGVKNVESLADHTYRVAIISAILSDKLKLNTERTIKMSLLHDLPEAYIGDITPHDISFKDKEKLERYTAEHIFDDLDEDERKEYVKILKEYLNQETEEARLVFQVDKLEMVYQAYEYEITQKVDLEEFYRNVEKKINIPTVIDLYKELKRKKRQR